MAKFRFGYLLGGLLATQVILGCQKEEESDAPQPMKVDVPSSMDHPSEMVGQWTEVKGHQTMSLGADGTCELTSKISLGSDVTHGEAKSFDQKTPAKWGTSGEKFFFTEIKGSPPLQYDWSLDGGKLLLNNSGSKLIYTRIVKKDEKK